MREHKPSNIEKTHKSPVFAAIDLGTNSCRLLVAAYEQKLRIIDSYAKVVRLGENMKEDNLLSSDAIDRSLKALAVCVRKAQHHQASRLRAITTEACRRARNGDELIRRARDELGLSLEVISPKEEALLALTGCSGVLTPHIPYGIAFDIGGGSTEVMWVKVGPLIGSFELVDWVSLPFGVVTLSDVYGSYGTSPSLYAMVREKIARILSAFDLKNGISQRMKQQNVQMIGTSGTITTLSAVSLGLQYYDRHKIDGISVRSRDIRRIAQSILHMHAKDRNLHPCIGVGRSDLVVTGSSILEGILDAFPVPWIRVADRGVREGILMQMFQEEYQGSLETHSRKGHIQEHDDE